MRAWIIGIGVAAVGSSVGLWINNVVNTAGSAVERTLLGHDVDATISSPHGPILAVDVRKGFGCSSHGWVFAAQPATIQRTFGPPSTNADGEIVVTPSSPSWQGDPASLGAAPAGPITVEVTASSDRGAIVLKGVHVHVTGRQRRIDGTAVNVRNGCGDGDTVHDALADLDRPPPYWVADPPLPVERSDELLFLYTVTSDDPSIIRADVTSETCRCRWYLDLDWVDGTDSGTTRIDDHGQPFESTPVEGLPSLDWQDGAGFVAT